MNVAALWVIYIIVVIIVWLVLALPCFGIMANSAVAAFFAFLIGAIVVAVLTATVNWSALTQTDKDWLYVLMFVAYIIPILIAIWIIFSCYYKEMCYKQKHMHCKKKPACQEKAYSHQDEYAEHHHHDESMKMVLDCDRASGECQTRKIVARDGDNVVKAIYR